MKSVLIYQDKPYLFKSSVEELIDASNDQMMERMCKDEHVGEDEFLILEEHRFPMDSFLHHIKGFAYDFNPPDFESLEDKKYLPIGAKPVKKFMVYNPYYSMDTGDEPQTSFSYFLAESEQAFKDVFNKAALEAVRKRDSIRIGYETFCTEDHVVIKGKQVDVIYPEIHNLN